MVGCAPRKRHRLAQAPASRAHQFHAPVAQLDRASGYEEVNGWFESREFGKKNKDLREEDVPHRMRSDQGVTRRRGRRLGRSKHRLLELQNAPVAQLDRVLGYEPRGREFESLQARHLFDSQAIFYSQNSLL